MRPVRLSESAAADVEAQLTPERAELFRTFDLAPALDLLASEGGWAEAQPHGPGRRLTIQGATAAGFHLFVIPDDLDPREGALVVFALYIWTEDLPD